MAGSGDDALFRFDTLRFRDQLVLWAARMWIEASAARPTFPDAVEEAFALAEVPEAGPLLHDLLTILTTTAHRTVFFNPAGCPLVSSEEACFLSMLAAARQDGCDACALRLLGRWVPAGAARRALGSARDLALLTVRRLQPRRVDVDDRSQAAARGGRGPTTPSPDPGVSLLH
ncbi:MAG: hypothetical protein ACFCUO_13110 [Rhodospirillales bacterium]